MATPNTERKLRPGTYYCENRGILKPVEKEAAQARGMNKTNSPLSDAVVLMLLSLQEKKERPPPPRGTHPGFWASSRKEALMLSPTALSR